MNTFLFAIGFICTVYTVIDVGLYLWLRYNLGAKEFERRTREFLAPKGRTNEDWRNY